MQINEINFVSAVHTMILYGNYFYNLPRDKRTKVKKLIKDIISC